MSAAEQISSGLSRRDFLRLGTALAATLGLGAGAARALADGLQKLAEGRKRVIWLQGQACSGCSISFLNAEQPGAFELVTEVISLIFHPTIGAAQGRVALDSIVRARDEGHYVLLYEGAICPSMPEACRLGDESIVKLLPELIRRADLVIGVGTCAAFGGIPAAEGNPTGAMSMKDFMSKSGIPTKDKLINCPGCPMHPESLVGTIAYAVSKGYPPVDAELLTPDMFYAQSVHDNCPRFHAWQKKEFAKQLGEEGCLFKLGCLGPLSRSTCPGRQWNGGINWCVRAGAPCVACTSMHFAHRRDFPFYRKGEKYHPVGYQDQDRQGASS